MFPQSARSVEKPDKNAVLWYNRAMAANEHTKQMIADAMRPLIEQKPIEKIRVGEICAAAGVDRTTFYYHFQDKYECVAWILRTALYPKDMHDFGSIADGFMKMRENFAFYRRIYADSESPLILRYIFEHFVGAYTESAKDRLGTNMLPTEIATGIRMFCYGCIYEGRDWLLRDDGTSAEEQARLMLAAMPESLRRVFVWSR